MSELAKDNGYVTASGRDDDGSQLERSTKDYPEIINIELPRDASRASLTRVVAERDG